MAPPSNFPASASEELSENLRCLDRFAPNQRRAAGEIEVYDLFSGAGGLSAGFEIAGRNGLDFRVAGAAELDSASNATFESNLGVKPLELDLSQVVSESDISDFCGQIVAGTHQRRVVIGGPPCQGFSAHSKRTGHSNDPRNSLVATFGTLAVALEPEVILMENVPEILSQRHWRHFEDFKRVLEDAGYQVRAQIHDLAEFGVPQHRYRALIVGSKSGFEMPSPILSQSSVRTVRDAIGALEEISPASPSRVDPMHRCSRHKKTTIRTIKQVPKDGGSRPKGVGPECLERVDGFRDVYGRLAWDRPANTITGSARNPASGRFVHPEQHRGLSIREAALIQGFPSRYFFEGSFDSKFSQIGNAVPPLFGLAIAKQVNENLRYANAEEDPRYRDIVTPTSDSFSSGIAALKSAQVAV